MYADGLLKFFIVFCLFFVIVVVGCCFLGGRGMTENWMAGMFLVQSLHDAGSWVRMVLEILVVDVCHHPIHPTWCVCAAMHVSTWELSAGTMETTLDKLFPPPQVSMETTALLMLPERCPTCSLQAVQSSRGKGPLSVFLLLHRLNRKAKYLLEKDLKDKFQAQDIDEYCENLKNNSAGLHLKDGAAKIEAKCVTLICWVFVCGAQSRGGQRLLTAGGGGRV